MQDEKVIDVVKIPRFIRFLPYGHVTITTKPTAEGIIGSDNQTVYVFATVESSDFAVVTIKEITEEEFNRLNNLLNSGKLPRADTVAMKNAKMRKTEQLSAICKSKITAGFYVTLDDNISYNFKLTTEDQLNLMALENQLNAGGKSFIYHATDQPCRCFTRSEMKRVISIFKRHVLYHTTYFNVAKQYIKSLTDIEKVNTFTYGVDLSSTVNDDTIKQILKNGGGRE